MAFGHIDVSLTADGSGNAQSAVKYADYLHNFATKCGPAVAYQYEFVDQDGFGIYSEPGGVTLTGPYASPINRRVKGFVVRVYNATPGETIVFRVGVD